MRIKHVKTRKILDSRGRFTIEVDISTEHGFGRASAPSGASVGRYEAQSLPEGGVNGALQRIRRLVAPALEGVEVEDQTALDRIIEDVDGTPDFSNIGASAALATSMAAAKAGAISQGKPLYRYLAELTVRNLPIPLGNVLGGGKHAGGKSLDVQEILVAPLDGKSFVGAVSANSEVHSLVGAAIHRHDETFVGGKTDEGAWTARLQASVALGIVREACEKVSDKMGVRMALGVDLASSSLWQPGSSTYEYRLEGKQRNSEQQFNHVCDLIEEFDLHYVEDPFHEDDWNSFSKLNRKYQSKRLVCGDDLFVTSVDRLRMGVERQAANCTIIKPNQCGTLTRTVCAAVFARENGLTRTVSHRSGETEDEGLAHLAVALGAEYIKTGAVGGERTVKLNELIRIEEGLGRV